MRWAPVVSPRGCCCKSNPGDKGDKKGIEEQHDGETGLATLQLNRLPRAVQDTKALKTTRDHKKRLPYKSTAAGHASFNHSNHFGQTYRHRSALDVRAVSSVVRKRSSSCLERSGDQIEVMPVGLYSHRAIRARILSNKEQEVRRGRKSRA